MTSGGLCEVLRCRGAARLGPEEADVSAGGAEKEEDERKRQSLEEGANADLQDTYSFSLRSK